MEIKFVFASSDTSWGDRFLFCTMLNDSLWYVFFRYDLDSGIQDTIGNHDDLATCVEYCDETCQVVSAGWDNKIMLWDTRMKKAPGCVKILGAEVESMSLSVFNLLVSAGASVNTYDLRPFKLTIFFFHSGFAVGSIDGRVTLQIPDPSNSNDTGSVYRFLHFQPLNYGFRT
ncbi:Mitotic checkpoint protein BUB3.3 [Vitis vinifera]|uniref:Mitotic checkpoint protein BUB3.3 n=1 Tax=Vitis vinifera TaxID=29760 RepID=A0A438GVV2_VITVI|nr:Mitotic checkpoint protein BUB3.3 [Vitis vinifera]